jgi:outer membrane receptor protein involved in Fe transport
MKTTSVIALILLISVGAAPAFAQTTGQVEGVVKDPTGAVIKGARVTATSPSLIGLQDVKTDGEGHYRLYNLPPGPYTISVEAQGFIRSEQKEVVVSLDRTTTLNVDLAPAGAAETVTVTSGDAAPLDATSSETNTVVSETLFTRLPTTRTLSSVISIAPSVVGGGLRDANGREAAPSIGGSSGPENNYILDGVSTTDPAFGTQGSNIAFDFIQEVQVKTFGFSAEYGHSTGGIINAITKSGGDEFHGDAFLYFNPSGFVGDAKESAIPLSNANGLGGNIPNGYSEYDFGGDLGGPVVKQKLWFFAAVNPQFRTNRYLGQSFRLPFENDVHTPFYAGKLTWQPHQDHRFTASTFSDRTTLEGGNPTSSGFSSDLDYLRIKQRTGGPNYAFKYDGSLTDRLLVSAVLGLHYQRFNIDSLSPDVPFVRNRQAIDPNTGFFTKDLVLPGSGFGGNFSSRDTPTSQRRDRYEIGADATYLLSAGDFGEHAIKAGYQYQVNHYDVYTRRSGGGRIDNFYTNLNPADFTHPQLEFAFSRFEAYELRADTRTKVHSFYVQDTWKVVPSLTLNLGVRWELPRVEPDEQSKARLLADPNFGRDYFFKFTKFWENAAPRLGFAWDFTRVGKGKIYGSYSRFFLSNIPLDLNARAATGETLIRYTYDGPNATGNLTGITAFGAAPTLVDPDLKQPYVEEATGGIEYELFDNFAVGARYVWRNLGRTIEDGSFDGGNTYFIMNPGESLTGRTPYVGPVDIFLTPDLSSLTHFDNTTIAFPTAIRRYRAVEITATKRFSNHYQYVASYTWSKLNGNYEGLYRNDSGQLDPNITSLFDLPELLYNTNGRLNNDRPHQFKLDGSYDWDFGLTAGLSFRAMSGTPVSLLGPSPAYGDGQAYLAPRGSGGRTPVITNTDLHVAYSRTLGERYRGQIIFDVFNVMNQQKAVEVDQLYRLDLGELSQAPVNPYFGRGTFFQYPISMRIGLKFSF